MAPIYDDRHTGLKRTETISAYRKKVAAMRNRTIEIMVPLVLLLFVPLYVHAGAPTDTVQSHVNQVLNVLRDPAMKAESAKEAKQNKIGSIAESLFDYTELSRRSLARNWENFSPSQQKEFAGLFGKLLGNTYMDRILAYTDEKVVYSKETMLSERTAEVQSKVVAKSGDIPIYYRLILKSDKWMVYDVIIEGVSLVNNYRGQFNQILSKNPPEHLIETVRKKVEQPQLKKK